MNTLYTDRLVLRPFREGDAAAVYRNWTQDERVARYCPWYPHKSVEDTEGYIKMCMGKKYCWAITPKDTGEPVGCIDVVGINDAGVPEIGYVLAHDYWGAGIMTEAAKAVLDELFRCGFARIEAHHHVDNPASGRVMEKCGMTYVRDGERRRKFGSDELCAIKCYEIARP